MIIRDTRFCVENKMRKKNKTHKVPPHFSNDRNEKSTAW